MKHITSYSQRARSYLGKERERARAQEREGVRESACACIQVLRAYIAMIYVRGGERGEKETERARAVLHVIAKHVSRVPRFQHQQPGHSMRGESGEREGERERGREGERERVHVLSLACNANHPTSPC